MPRFRSATVFLESLFPSGAGTLELAKKNATLLTSAHQAHAKLLNERLHGSHVFADAHASGRGEQPQWLYTVAFSARDLWDDGDQELTVSIDAWEPYLQSS